MRLTLDNKIAALMDAAAFLELQESESDEPGDQEARFKLRDRLLLQSDRLKDKRDKLSATRTAGGEKKEG